MDIVRIECHLMRVNLVKFHLAVASFAACDITSVIHSVVVLYSVHILAHVYPKYVRSHRQTSCIFEFSKLV